MRIYCDTDTLSHNVERHANQPEVRAELDALRLLLKQHADGRVVMYRSRVNLRELEQTRNADQLRLLAADYEALEPVPLGERHYGNSEEMVDPFGSVVSSPLVSDVQDEKILAELQGYGLSRRDAEHITQAGCNGCEVFLTRDRALLLKFRPFIEARFPQLRVLQPSQLEVELALPAQSAGLAKEK